MCLVLLIAESVAPAWRMTIDPLDFFAPLSVSVLSLVLLLACILIQLFRVDVKQYGKSLSRAALTLSLLSTFVLILRLINVVQTWDVEFFAFIHRAVGYWWMVYLFLELIPLLLSQLFYKKELRLRMALIVFVTSLFQLPYILAFCM